MVDNASTTGPTGTSWRGFCFICGREVLGPDERNWWLGGFNPKERLDLISLPFHDECVAVLHERVKGMMRDERRRIRELAGLTRGKPVSGRGKT